MVSFTFYKYHGCGNDFIVFDNRQEVFPSHPMLIKNLCHRKFGIGADGIVLIKDSTRADFTMQIYNSDGNEAAMCGNALCCLAHFLPHKISEKKSHLIETRSGLRAVTYLEKEEVLVSLGRPFRVELERKLRLQDMDFCYHFVNVGVPHVIFFVDSFNLIDITKLGKLIRNYESFQPEGVNVNFVEIQKDKLKIRTYERGVEEETLACGTGGAAVSVVYSLLSKKRGPVSLEFSSQENVKYFIDRNKEGIFDVKMRGKATPVFEGMISFS